MGPAMVVPSAPPAAHLPPHARFQQPCSNPSGGCPDLAPMCTTYPGAPHFQTQSAAFIRASGATAADCGVARGTVPMTQFPCRTLVACLPPWRPSPTASAWTMSNSGTVPRGIYCHRGQWTRAINARATAPRLPCGGLTPSSQPAPRPPGLLLARCPSAYPAKVSSPQSVVTSSLIHQRLCCYP